MMSRRIFTGTSALIRGLCTALELEAEGEKTVAAATAAKRGKDERLYNRLSALGTKKGLVAQTINGYIREGRVARKDVLDSCIVELRKFGRHHQALEIMEWMERRKINLAKSDRAKWLDLICKVHGIAAAENYFSGLSPSEKNHMTYGALLNCYCVEKMTDKALGLFEKMDEMKMLPTSLAFNNLMSLYLRLGHPGKVPPLVQVLKERNIRLSSHTYNIWMQSYSRLGDIEGVERVFEEIKQESEKVCDWTIYSNLAVAYVDAGLHEKAELALKRLEETGSRNREAFHYMISLYSRISNLGQVYRVWNTLKSRFRAVTNISYLTMLRALRKLSDIDGLKKCFKEWESVCSIYDIRLANVAIGAYLSHNMANEAELVLRDALERSTGPFFTAWEMLMTFYLENHQMRLALRCMEAATSSLNEFKWHPKSDDINKFLEYFEGERDVDGAEEFCQYLKKVYRLDYNVYKSLLQTYIAAGRLAPDIRVRVEEDGIDLSSELEDLLKIVCPE